jgi:hypothetical protein
MSESEKYNIIIRNCNFSKRGQEILNLFLDRFREENPTAKTLIEYCTFGFDCEVAKQ